MSPDGDSHTKQHQRVAAAASLTSVSESTAGGRGRLSDSAAWRSVRLPASLTVVGVLGLAAAFLLPGATGQTTVFLALGGSSLFLAALTAAIRPTFRQSMADTVFAAGAATNRTFVDGLGLSETQVYVPTGGESPVRLFVPRDPDSPVPDPTSFDGFDVRDHDSLERVGVALDTSGLAVAEAAGLLDSVHELPDEPGPLFDALRSTAVERLGLAERSTATVDGTAGRAVVSFGGPRYGSVSQFDHPARAFLGAMVALRLGHPVSSEAITTSDGGVRIRYTWPVD